MMLSVIRFPISRDRFSLKDITPMQGFDPELLNIHPASRDSGILRPSGLNFTKLESWKVESIKVIFLVFPSLKGSTGYFP